MSRESTSQAGALAAGAIREEGSSTTDCPPEAVFVEHLEGRLAAPDAARLERHAAACTACHALLSLTRGISGENERVPRSAPAGDSESDPGSALSPGQDDPTRWLGRTIDRKYDLVRVLGQGGMGFVFEARRIETGERFAVKLINGRLLVPGSDAESRFRREARAAGALGGPHIVAVVDTGADEATGDLYLVMEHLEGEDLQKLIDRTGPLPPGVALRIAMEALLGLERAHAAGVVHRDIKPANLFLARRDGGDITVKLLDFGVAKILADPLALPHTTGLTHTGGIIGSPLYMSPEQVQNSKAVDHRTDLWSLGSTLYCALAGRPPHRGVGSVGRLILAICTSPAPPLRGLAPWVPHEVASAVHRALAIDPAERYPSAAAMLAALTPLAPGGALRDDMLVGLTAEERAAVAEPPPEQAAGEALDAARALGWRAMRSSAALTGAAALVLGSALAATHAARRAPRAQAEAAPAMATALTAGLAPGPPAPAPAPPLAIDAGAPPDPTASSHPPAQDESGSPSSTHRPPARAAPRPPSSPATGTLPNRDDDEIIKKHE